MAVTALSGSADITPAGARARSGHVHLIDHGANVAAAGRHHYESDPGSSEGPKIKPAIWSAASRSSGGTAFL